MKQKPITEKNEPDKQERKQQKKKPIDDLRNNPANQKINLPAEKPTD
jgi:hypothetical protein